MDTSNTQPEIQHIEAGNKGIDKATDKEEIEEADNNQSSKGKVEDCAGAIDDHAVGDAEGVSQDCNDETNKIIFGDTLLKYLDKVKAKADKQQLKWNGDLQQLKDFITLILNLRGTWKKVGTKNTFREANGKLMINWWHTNKTLSLQGSGDTVEEYEKRLWIDIKRENPT